MDSFRQFTQGRLQAAFITGVHGHQGVARCDGVADIGMDLDADGMINAIFLGGAAGAQRQSRPATLSASKAAI